MSDEVASRVRIRGVTILSGKHFILRETQYDYRRREGEWVLEALK